ncbi:MAG: ParA family protein [bacterium]|nr:ParA family protein [bacterium]
MIARSIVVGVGKGGVGKTTIAINVAANWAESHGEPILLVDCDTQATATRALGLYDRTDGGDGGRGLLDAVLNHQKLHATSNRGDLWVCTAGPHTRDLARRLASLPAVVAGNMLERAFAGHDFTAVVFDLPPTGQSGLADAAIAAGQTLVIPTGHKPHDLTGLPVLASQLQNDGNDITVLGVVLNAVPIQARSTRERAVEAISSHLADGVTLFDSMIRNADAAMVQAGRCSMTVSEYSAWAKTVSIRRRIAGGLSIPSNLEALNAELHGLTGEIRDRFLTVQHPPQPA